MCVHCFVCWLQKATNETGVCAVVFVFLSAARKTLCVLVQQGSGSVLFVCLWLCEENLSRSLTARKISHGARKISHGLSRCEENLSRSLTVRTCVLAVLTVRTKVRPRKP